MFLKWVNISNNSLLKPFIFFCSCLPLFDSVEPWKVLVIAVTASSLAAAQWVRRELRLFPNPSLGELSFFDLFYSSLENPTHKTCLYLTWLRAQPLWKAFSSRAFVKNNQEQLFNIPAARGSGKGWDKQQANCKTWMEKTEYEMFIGALKRMWCILRVLEGYPRKAEFMGRGAYILKKGPRMP